jgi:hypothetical protein
MITEYICPYCGDTSLSIKGAKRHVYKNHPEKIEDFEKIFSPDLDSKIRA